jgi:hypothetical protein
MVESAIVNEAVEMIKRGYAPDQVVLRLTQFGVPAPDAQQEVASLFQLRQQAEAANPQAAAMRKWCSFCRAPLAPPDAYMDRYGNTACKMCLNGDGQRAWQHWQEVDRRVGPIRVAGGAAASAKKPLLNDVWAWLAAIAAVLVCLVNADGSVTGRALIRLPFVLGPVLLASYASRLNAAGIYDEARTKIIRCCIASGAIIFVRLALLLFFRF